MANDTERRAGRPDAALRQLVFTNSTRVRASGPAKAARHVIQIIDIDDNASSGVDVAWPVLGHLETADAVALHQSVLDRGTDGTNFPVVLEHSPASTMQVILELVRGNEVLGPAVEDVEMLLTLAIGAATELPGGVSLTDRAKKLLRRIEIDKAMQHSVLAEGVIGAREVGELLGSAGKNLRDKASRLRTKGELLGVDIDGRVQYPVFQFDAARSVIRPGVAQANLALDAVGDPWGVASWWLAPHGRLPRSTTPADLAIEGDTETLAALVNSALIED